MGSNSATASRSRSHDVLQNLDLVRDAPPEDLELLGERSAVRRYPKHTIVVMEGDTQNQLFVILSGTVKVFADDVDGKQIILKQLGAGEYFGELSVLDQAARSASIATLTECEFLTVAGEDFRTFLMSHPSLMMRMMRHLIGTIRDLTGSVRDLALLDVYGRVIRVIERLSENAALEAGQSEEPRVTHQDIANMVGASREMVSRVMKELNRGKYICQADGRIRILKPLPKSW